MKHVTARRVRRASPRILCSSHRIATAIPSLDISAQPDDNQLPRLFDVPE